MKIITGSSKVVQGTGETQMLLFSYEFGVEGSEQERVRDRSIVQGAVHELGEGDPLLLGQGLREPEVQQHCARFAVRWALHQNCPTTPC